MTASRPDESMRQLLATTPAPRTPLAVVTSFSTPLTNGFGMKLQYVPDRLLLTQAGFQAYSTGVGNMRDVVPETFAAMIAEDVANELVPKWLRVTVMRVGEVTHAVVVEDRQPGWDHPTLLKSV